MKEQKLLHRVLISQDAGWYHIGEKNSGSFRSFTTLFNEFILKLQNEGFTKIEIDQLTRLNPADAFSVTIRKN